tara:strand:- start:283 stop:498 length:216 start_codon:yes stop_codon:yes gene_type:complete
MTWKETIKKASLESHAGSVLKMLRMMQKDFNLKNKELEIILKIVLEDLELSRGEMEEERRVDSIAGSRFER